MNWNTLKIWCAGNKPAAIFTGGFLLSVLALGYLNWSAWDQYSTVIGEFSSKSAKLHTLYQAKPYPSKENLKKLEEIAAHDRGDLELLRKELQSFHIPSFGNFEQTKPQDRPQQFQDALRAQVTKITSSSATAGSTLPTHFYLGMEQYENKLPGSEEVTMLSKQLTVLSWISEELVSRKGLIISEFSRPVPEGSTKKDAVAQKKDANTSKKQGTAPTEAKNAATPPYESVGTIRITFRCPQSVFRDLINAIASAPYFLVIESLQVQNSAKEPPRRTTSTQSPQASEQSTATLSRRLPIVVGKEVLNVSMRIRILEFGEAPTQAGKAK